MNIFELVGWKSKKSEPTKDYVDAGDVKANALTIKQTLAEFNIHAEIVVANVGPRFTSYEINLPPGVDFDHVLKLEPNIALNLQASSIRLVSKQSDSSSIAVEAPHVKSLVVRLGTLLPQASNKENVSNGFEIILGKNVMGEIVSVNLSTLPNVMIAGQTGSGKSAMLNNILANLLGKNTPETLRLLLVDPKQVEFSPYEGIPHLLRPVIKNPEEWEAALDWSVQEMSRRLQLFAESGKKDIDAYNASAEEPLPHIVIVSDEFSDMMMVNGRNTERLVSEIAQKSLTTGIHMVISTSRPSVDVYTEIVRAAFPARMAFVTATATDSMFILDEKGAEKLLGRGDLLLKLAAENQPERLQAAYVTDDEVEQLASSLRVKL